MINNYSFINFYLLSYSITHTFSDQPAFGENPSASSGLGLFVASKGKGSYSSNWKGPKPHETISHMSFNQWQLESTFRAGKSSMSSSAMGVGRGKVVGEKDPMALHSNLPPPRRPRALRPPVIKQLDCYKLYSTSMYIIHKFPNEKSSGEGEK